jgi:S1-C subfamily serine protease
MLHAEMITVGLADGRRVEAKRLVASRGDDLAILGVAFRGLTELALGDQDGLDVGDFVLAVGNPLEMGQSVTFGIVSALHRAHPGIENRNLIVTDALIDHGESERWEEDG